MIMDKKEKNFATYKEFAKMLRAEGYDATWTDSRKNITYTTPDGRKCRDNKLHIEKYLKENMEDEFAKLLEQAYCQPKIDLSSYLKIYDEKVICASLINSCI